MGFRPDPYIPRLESTLTRGMRPRLGTRPSLFKVSINDRQPYSGAQYLLGGFRERVHTSSLTFLVRNRFNHTAMVQSTMYTSVNMSTQFYSE